MFFPEPQLFPADADVNNCELLRTAMAFQQSLLFIDQYGLWNVMSAVHAAPPHPNPDYRDSIRNNMREMAQGYVLLFYFSIWDHYFDQEKSTEVLESWCTPDEALRFRAIKHVRHCIAHSFDGKRAIQNKPHFDEVMAGPTPFHGVEFTDNTIDLASTQIATESRDFFSALAPQLVARLANNSPP